MKRNHEAITIVKHRRPQIISNPESTKPSPNCVSHRVLQIELQEAESKDLMSCLGQVSLAQNAQMRSCCQSQLQLLLYLCSGPRVAQEIMLCPVSQWQLERHIAGCQWSFCSYYVFVEESICFGGSCFSYIHEIEFPWEESSSFAS